MVIRERANKVNPKDIEKVIEKGGGVKEDKSDTGVIRFTLTLPKQLVDQIDKIREESVIKIPRHRWVLEAIYYKINSGKK